MQPLHVEELDLEAPDYDRSEEYSQDEKELVNTLANKKVQKAVNNLRNAIFLFKQNLFEQIVNHDTTHNASDLGSMMSFHALFLQSVSYWISLLDSSLVPEPRFSKDQNTNEFQKIKTAIQKVSKSSPDARIHVYQLLFQFSQQHPFDLGRREELV